MEQEAWMRVSRMPGKKEIVCFYKTAKLMTACKNTEDQK